MTLPDLTEAQVNLVLTALGQRPYVEVAAASGTITLAIGNPKSTTGFTASGSKGTNSTTITYTLS